MKKPIFIISLSFLLFVSIVKAQGVSLYLSPIKLSVNAGETKSVDVVIKNLQDVKDIFLISIWPPLEPTTGIYSYIHPRIELLPNQEIKIPLTFIVPECTVRKNLLFIVTVSSIVTPTIKDEKTLTLEVKGEGFTCVTQVGMSKPIFSPNERAKININIANYDKDKEVVVEVTIKKDREIKKSFSEEIFLKSGEIKNLEYEYELPKYALAGEYKVDVLLKEDGKVISSKETKFNVETIEKLDYSYFTKNLMILQTGSVKIKNLGNVLSKPTTQSLIIPWFMKIFFYPQTELLKETEFDGQVIYTWAVPALNPLEEYEIKYEFRFWPIWLGVGLVIIFSIFIYFRLYSIKVVKKTKPTILKIGREIPISISVVNNSLNELKDVLVKDLVPPVVAVSEKFETLKPVMKRTRAGTQLNWRISSLKPGEEIILSYRIIPIVDIVGSLKLPKAEVSFVSKGKEKKILVSKPIIITPA